MSIELQTRSCQEALFFNKLVDSREYREAKTFYEGLPQDLKNIGLKPNGF